MNLKLLVARWYIPGSYRKAKLAELDSITARAFAGEHAPAHDGNFNSLLSGFARSTAQRAAQATRKRGSLETLQSRLYAGAYRMGRELRRELGVKSGRDFRMAVRAIYRALRIDFSCGENGEFTVSRCFFSAYYNAEVCRIVSWLDAGLVAGLSGGLRMDFTRRITENSCCCKGRIA
jgi:hypothetical protein